jgi:hypothetical protein
MKDPITARAAHLLTQSSHILVPLEDLYNALEDEGLMAWVDPEMFEYLMATDETFVIIEGLEALEMLTPLLRAELQMQGFWSGPLVMLRLWTAFPSLILEDLLTHLQDMSDALESAWQTRSPDDPFSEAELLNMLMMSDMVAREISGALHVYVESEENDAQDLRPGNNAVDRQDII